MIISKHTNLIIVIEMNKIILKIYFQHIIMSIIHRDNLVEYLLNEV